MTKHLIFKIRQILLKFRLAVAILNTALLYLYLTGINSNVQQNGDYLCLKRQKEYYPESLLRLWFYHAPDAESENLPPKVKAGVYIYYQYAALQEAKNLAKKDNSDLDTDDEKALKKVKIQGKDFLQWVEDKAVANCSEHVAVLKHFDEMELTLSDDDKDSIASYVDNAYENNPDMFEGNGIGKESLEEVMTSTYKSQEIFNALYGDDGTEGVKEDDIKKFYEENK